MSSIVYLVAAYTVVGVGLALYILALRRQQARLIEALAAWPKDQHDSLQPEG